MIEVSMQVTCDGCGNDDCGQADPIDGLDVTRKNVREMFAKFGWRHYGSKDYCQKCVKSGKYAARSGVFETEE